MENRRPRRTIPVLFFFVCMVGLSELRKSLQFAKSPDFVPIQHEYERLFLGKKMNLNKATERDLLYIDRLSKKAAKGIIEYRAKHKQIQTYEELDDILGIGPKSLARIRENTYLSKQLTQ